MLTLYDYAPSQNAWKVRQLLHHLQQPYRRVAVSIFEGEGQRPEFLRVNPTGKVPALQLDDGRCLAESSAILMYLASGTPYLPDDAYARAVVQQWLSIEQEQVESSIGALRHWTLTGKLPRRAPALVDAKRQAGARALRLLDGVLAGRPFITGTDYTIADIALFAYTSRAEEAGYALAAHPHVGAWVQRVQAQPRFLAASHSYAEDPHSGRELP